MPDCGAANVFCKYQVDMHHLGVRCQVGVVDGFTSWLNVYLGLLVHCWVSGATHGACTVCGVGVVDPLWPVICFPALFVLVGGWWVWCVRTV